MSRRIAAVIAPGQARAPEATSRTKHGRMPLEKDLRPIPSPHANHDVGAVADGRPRHQHPCLHRDHYPVSRRRNSSPPKAKAVRNGRLPRPTKSMARPKKSGRFPSLHGGAGDEPRFAREEASAVRKPGGPASPCRRRLLVPNASLPCRGADIERYRPADLEPPVQPERGRGAEPKDAPRERERTRPHNRAGEPGYVPRRERLRRWNKGPARNHPQPNMAGRATGRRRSRYRITRVSGGRRRAPGPTPAGRFGGRRAEGKRRRRRRGRRRERERPELEATSPTAEEFPPEFDEPGPNPATAQGFPRRPADERLSEEKLDDIDLDLDDLEPGEEPDADDLEIDEDDVMVDDLRAEPARVAEEEIDPELEEEIRKEIEEIEELEREMGLRGPVEARPRPR